MTEIEFSQPARRASLIIGGAYVVVVLTFAFVFFDQVSEIVNYLAGGGYMATGFLVAAVCFIPLFIILRLLRQKVTLRQDESSISVRVGRREDVIPRDRIQRIIVHEPALGPVRLCAADGGILLSLNPPARDYARVVSLLLDGDRYVEAGRQPVFGGRMTALTYATRTRS